MSLLLVHCFGLPLAVLWEGKWMKREKVLRDTHHPTTTSCLNHFKLVRQHFPEPFHRNVLGGCLFVVVKASGCECAGKDYVDGC